MSVKKYADSTGLSEFWSKVKGRSIELTQSQYNALSQAEKENGTVYFITDGDPEYTVVNDSVPIGAIQAYAGDTPPFGWLFCDGTAVSRTTYSDLFAAIGTTYGSGDGATTFNLPDLRGRTLVGVGNSGATGSTNHTLGQKDGEEKHTLTVNEMPSHKHSFHGWVFNGSSRPGSGAHYGIPYQSDTGDPFTFTSDWNSGQVPWGGDNTGDDQAHNLMQPYTVANYIIKALDTVSSSMLKQLDPQSIIFDALYPVGSYYETSDSTFNPNEQWSGTWEIELEKNAIGASASHGASTTGSNYYTGTMITLLPQTKYLLLGRGSDNLGATTTNVSQFYVSSGTAKLFREQTSQPTSNSGNTHVFTAYIETGDSSVGVGVASYDYSSGYTKTWAITAVPLNQREDAKRWHRIA